MLFRSQPPRDIVYPGEDAPSALTVGGFLGERLVGVATVHPDPERSAAFRLRGMAVVADLRDRGIGSLLLKPAHATSDADLRAVLDANLVSAFNAVRSGAKAMQSQGGGSIVLVSSAAARAGLANHEAIAAAKGGVIGLTLSAAATYAPKQVRVNCVAPGLVRTPMTERIWSSEAALQASVAMHALGRIGEPDEVAAAIAFFLDPANAWITGQVLGVDGGLGSIRPR